MLKIIALAIAAWCAVFWPCYLIYTFVFLPIKNRARSHHS